MSWPKRAASGVACWMLASCAHPAAAPSASVSPCRTPMPLELRLARIEQRLAEAYAHAPPLSLEERQETRRLAACTGASALGVGTGCSDEWENARASGLAERNHIRAAEFDIPERVRRAATLPLGAERSNDLIVAMLTAGEAEAALRTHLSALPNAAATRDDPLKLMLVEADLHQALVCDAGDLAAGRRRGLPFDPSAPIPPGP